MKTIKTEPVLYKGEKRLKLVFGYDKDLVKEVKRIPGARWSQTMGCWHIPCMEDETVLSGLCRNCQEADANGKQYLK